jgi:hypothetical protein
MASIWQKLAYIQSDEARISMLETLLAGPEYVYAAKQGGVYAFVLQWIAAYRRGERPAWPGQRAAQVPQPQPQQQPLIPTQSQSHTQAKYYPPPTKEATAIATVPPPKRALDALHQAYEDLGIDDSQPLTYEALRAAYKRAATRAHPDRGGSSEMFDNVTRSFLFLEEVIQKLIPRRPTDLKSDTPVTMEAALKARDVPLTRYAAQQQTDSHTTDIAYYTGAKVSAKPPSQTTHDQPPVALNPKKLDMNLFNKLFEENRLPDPDQDGYGDWLKSSGEDTRVQNADTLRSKFNRDVFNRTFEEQAASATAGGALTRYQAPDAITHTQGVELGAGRPSHYISPMGSKTGYTDLKYAYGEGSTFSQEVANVAWETGKKSFEQVKQEREAAPVPLSEREAAILASIEAQKAKAEEERQRRLAARDVQTEDVYSRMQRRLLIQK